MTLGPFRYASRIQELPDRWAESRDQMEERDRSLETWLDQLKGSVSSVGLSTNRPRRPAEGAIRLETDTRSVVAYVQGAWVTISAAPAWGALNSWTPSLESGGSGANISATGSWRYDGQWIDWELSWSCSGLLTVGGILAFRLPVAILNNPGTPGLSPDPVVGTASFLDASTQRYRANVVMYDNIDALRTLVNFDYGYGAGQIQAAWNAPFTWNVGDVGHASGRYRWA